jgi:ABC-type glycerol-3-phosphate transport system substrate-binding protein
MVRPRLFRTLMLYLVLILLLAGCSGAATPAATLMPAETPVGSDSLQAPLTLYLWHAWPTPEQRTLTVLVEQFNQANSNIRIVAQSRPVATLLSDLQTAVSEGRGPHLALLQSHSLGTLVNQNMLLELTALISPSELAGLLPVTVGTAQVDEAADARLYALPISFDTLALFYNRVNWLRPPTDTETWLDGARTLTDAQSKPPTWGLAYHLSLDKTIGYLYAFGGQIFDEQGELVLGTSGREGTLRWLEWLVMLKQDPRLLASLDPMAVDNALLTQQALMTIDWAHALPTYQRLWGDNLGVAALPPMAVDEAAPRPYVQSDLITISALVNNPGEQQAALAFARFMISETAQRALLNAGRQPTLADLALASDNPNETIAMVFRQQAQSGQPMPNSQLASSLVWSVLDDMRFNVLRGLAEPQQAIDSAEQSLRARLDLLTPTR